MSLDTTKVLINQFLAQKAKVWVNKNTELGVLRYSVQVVGTDFWMESFTTKKAALAYVKEHALPLSRRDVGPSFAS